MLDSAHTSQGPAPFADDGGGDQPEAERLSRALASFVRAEFDAPVSAVIGLLELLREDIGREGADTYLLDLEKMQLAAQRVRSMVGDLLEGEIAQEAGPNQDVAAFSSKLRHDLRTPLTALLGYGELLSEEARDEGRETILSTLTGVMDAGRRLLGQIDAMMEFMRATRDGSPPGDAAVDDVPEATILRQALDSIRPVLMEEHAVARAIAAGRILVVDDNPSNRELLSRRLSRDGHEITTCADGQSALDLLRTREVDLVLLDLMMPGISGIEVLRQLRGSARTERLPVIVISALDEVDSAVRCIEAGADDYLAKPLNPTLLQARIGAAMDRKLLRDRDQATTQQLRAEQQRSESLLRNVLPEKIVERLSQGETVIADHFASATILFCDLVGFTPLAAGLSPETTLQLLNRIFSGFDGLAARFRLEKIKTIGDAYMVAGGLPHVRTDHAMAVAEMALRMGKVVEEVSRDIGRLLDIRIGVHTGPVVAGVIGTHKFAYDVWGDTVNIASRMEHHGAPGRIHISAATRDMLGRLYRFDDRAPIEVKGRGIMQTYFLEGRA